MRWLITVFRQAGFDVGFSEVGLDDLNETTLSGCSMVGPIDRVYEHGPVPVEP